MAIRVRFGALLSAASIVVILVSLIAGCGQAAKPSSPVPSASVQAKKSAVTWQHQPPGKPAGEAAAQALLESVVLPPGAQRLTTSPGPAFDQPSSRAVNDNFIDHHSWWKVALSPDELMAYLRNHVPVGLTVSGYGSGTNTTGRQTSQSLSFGPAAPSAGRPALQFTLAEAGGRTSWLRVDGQAIWYPPRPAAETAPSEGVVTIRLSSGPTRQITDPAAVRRLATEFNRLIRTTPGVSTGLACFPNEPTLSLAFTKTGALQPSVVASASGCSVRWSVHGPSGALPALDGGADLRNDALRLLGLTEAALSPPPTG